MVAEVVRLLGYTENARILTNPATEILNGVGHRCHPEGALATEGSRGVCELHADSSVAMAPSE